MPVTAIEVQGARALRRQLRAAGIELADLKAEHGAAAALIVRRQAPSAPRRTGALAGSVRGSGQAGAAVVRVGRAAVPYANPIHWGWPRRGIPARPWLWDTINDSRDAVVDTYETGIQRLLDRVDTKGQP